MKEVRTYKTEIEAEYDAGLLQSQGIACKVRNRRPIKGSPLDPSVWVVHDGDLPRALEALDFRPDSSGQPWACSECRSKNEAQFDACWSCGVARVMT